MKWWLWEIKCIQMEHTAVRYCTGVSPLHHSRRHLLHRDPHPGRVCNRQKKTRLCVYRWRVSGGDQLPGVVDKKQGERDHSLVVTGWMWVVKVTVRVDLAEQAQAQPAEVLSTWGTGHLVTPIHFLERHGDKDHQTQVAVTFVFTWLPSLILSIMLVMKTNALFVSYLKLTAVNTDPWW